MGFYVWTSSKNQATAVVSGWRHDESWKFHRFVGAWFRRWFLNGGPAQSPVAGKFFCFHLFRCTSRIVSSLWRTSMGPTTRMRLGILVFLSTYFLKCASDGPCAWHTFYWVICGRGASVMLFLLPSHALRFVDDQTFMKQLEHSWFEVSRALFIIRRLRKFDLSESSCVAWSRTLSLKSQQNWFRLLRRLVGNEVHVRNTFYRITFRKFRFPD